MAYIIYLDVSAKVEQWSQSTVVAFSDGIQATLLADGRTKQEARDWLHRKYPNHGPSFYYYRVDVALIYLLVRPYLGQIERLIIDDDYPGAESQKQIKDLLLAFVQRDYPSLRGEFVHFREVRGSTADVLARETFRGVKKGTKKADRAISLKDIQDVFEPKKRIGAPLRA